MGVNDAREQLEVCKDEYGKLERENAELRQAMVELQPAEVLVEGSYFPVGDLPEVLGNYIRASAEYARDAKAAWVKVVELQAVIKRVKLARSNHPECDIHPDDDIVKCGWKRAVLDIDKALSQGDEEPQ